MDRDMQEGAAMQALDRNTRHRTYASTAGATLGKQATATPRVESEWSGVLDLICERILSASYQVREMGSRLEYHTDQVCGAVPQNSAKGADGTELPSAKLDRIDAALNTLDCSLGYLAEQTGRATTLA